MNQNIDTTEVLKSLGVVSQQITVLVATHQKATTALSHFEMENANAERRIHMCSNDEKTVRKRLKGSIKAAKFNLKEAYQLRNMLNELMSVEAVS